MRSLDDDKAIKLIGNCIEWSDGTAELPYPLEGTLTQDRARIIVRSLSRPSGQIELTLDKTSDDPPEWRGAGLEGDLELLAVMTGAVDQLNNIHLQGSWSQPGLNNVPENEVHGEWKMHLWDTRTKGLLDVKRAATQASNAAAVLECIEQIERYRKLVKIHRQEVRRIGAAIRKAPDPQSVAPANRKRAIATLTELKQSKEEHIRGAAWAKARLPGAKAKLARLRASDE